MIPLMRGFTEYPASIEGFLQVSPYCKVLLECFDGIYDVNNGNSIVLWLYEKVFYMLTPKSTWTGSTKGAWVQECINTWKSLGIAKNPEVSPPAGAAVCIALN
jgi:hypothetical protein